MSADFVGLLSEQGILMQLDFLTAVNTVHTPDQTPGAFSPRALCC